MRLSSKGVNEIPCWSEMHDDGIAVRAHEAAVVVKVLSCWILGN